MHPDVAKRQPGTFMGEYDMTYRTEPNACVRTSVHGERAVFLRVRDAQLFAANPESVDILAGFRASHVFFDFQFPTDSRSLRQRQRRPDPSASSSTPTSRHGTCGNFNMKYSRRI